MKNEEENSKCQFLELLIWPKQERENAMSKMQIQRSCNCWWHYTTVTVSFWCHKKTHLENHSECESWLPLTTPNPALWCKILEYKLDYQSIYGSKLSQFLVRELITIFLLILSDAENPQFRKFCHVLDLPAPFSDGK